MAEGQSGEPSVMRDRIGPKSAFVGAILISLVLICSGIALAADGDVSDDPVQAALSAPPPPEPLREIESARTANSQTFLLADGSREARISETPINFREDGEWRPIVEGFEPNGQGFDDRDHPFDVSLPARIGDAPVRFSTPSYSISFELASRDSTSGEQDGANAVSYAVPSIGAKIGYSTLADGLKETIELRDPTSPSTIRYKLDATAGFRPTLSGDGSIAFRDPKDEVVAVLPAPIASDSSLEATQGRHAAYALSARDGGGWTLAVEVDRAWLDAPDRDWPVLVDPTVYEVGSGGNCALIQEAPNQSYCSVPSIFSAWTSASNQSLVRTLLNIGVSGIPVDASVKEATVSLWGETWGPTTGIEVRRVSTPWNNGASWNKVGCIGSACANWTTPGGDFTSEGSEILTSERGTQTGWWNFSKGLRPIFQAWVAGQVKSGLIVKQKDEGVFCASGNVACGLAFASYSDADPQKRPVIRVVYWPQAPLSSKVVSPTEGTVSARRLKLKSKWSSAGVSGVSYEFREGKAGPFATIPVELVRTASGAAVSKWPVPTSGFESEPLYFDAAHATPALQKKGGPIQVRAVFEGPAEVEGYSAPVEATINRFTGGPRDASAAVGPGTLDLLTGNLAVTRTDVALPSFNSTLAFSRTHSSRGVALKGTTAETEENRSVLGSGWKPGVPIEQTGGSAWRNLKFVEEHGTYEEEVGEDEVVEREYSFSYVLATTLDGAELAFERLPDGSYTAPPEVTGWRLTVEPGKFVLADPSGTITTFESAGSANEYLPVAVSQPGSSTNTTRVEYKLIEGRKRISMIVAPTPQGISCNTESEATVNIGCHALVFTYAPATTWGAPASYGDRLQKITAYSPGNGGAQIAANYKYDVNGRLIEEWDGRLSSPLVEKYTYTGGGQLATITPPGQEPWKMEYGTFDAEEANGRLVAIRRASLLASPTEAQTTIAYGVPVSGAGAPYDLGASQLSQWAQTDTPVDATAIFPPTQVPSANPPTSYSAATVYYLDAEGQNVDTASPKGNGTTAPSISVSETDEFGHVVRELTAANRLRALAEPEGKRAERSKELDSHRLYSADGTQMEEEWGPMHSVRLEDGTTTQARLHKVVQYDKNWPGSGVKPHLPTRETFGALVGGEVVDQRVTEKEYDWNLRQPTSTLVDPGTGRLNIKTVIAYDPNTGLPTESRQPKDAGSAAAGTTKTIYYKATGSGECQGSPKYANLPCRIAPVAQASGGATRPELLVKFINAYSPLGQPSEVLESPGGGAASLRKTVIGYDAIGRMINVKQTGGGGVELPKSEIEYSKTTGLPVARRFVCEVSCTGFDDQAVVATYDALGRVTGYQDADGNAATTTYDVMGRPVITSDGKGTQTRTYDAITGLLTELQDSAAGKFTATYDADGNVVERGYPNGMVAKYTYDESGAATHLSYVKTTMCSVNCTWLDFGSAESIYGQVIAQSSNFSKQEFSYDRAGRLTRALDTSSAGSCVTRSYTYDADSNRTKLVSRPPGAGGACDVTSTGSTQSYSYDGGDRLTDANLVYDGFGRITTLPASYAGGSGALTTEFFTNDLVAKQVQGGITNTYQLDGSGRQRQRVQVGGPEGTEVFHYASESDAPAWTIRGSAWSRNIPGIGGELAAIQDSSAGTVLQLTNLHGDVVASASLSQAATKLLATFESDEFGNPKLPGPPRFDWLGGKQRRTELTSGVIQMGARTYVPALGRFIAPDPLPGGSANPYDYANQDPVNAFDLDGTCSTKKGCRAKRREGAAGIRKAVNHLQAKMQTLREKRAAATAGASMVPVGGGNFNVPWEKAANSAIEQAETAVNSIFGIPCDDASEVFGHVAEFSGGTALLLAKGPPGAQVVAGILATLSGFSAVEAGALWGGSKLGIC